MHSGNLGTGEYKFKPSSSVKWKQLSVQAGGNYLSVKFRAVDYRRETKIYERGNSLFGLSDASITQHNKNLIHLKFGGSSDFYIYFNSSDITERMLKAFKHLIYLENGEEKF
jgi:hypothetical protein